MQNIKNILTDSTKTLKYKKDELKKLSIQNLKKITSDNKIMNRSFFKKKNDIINLVLSYFDLLGKSRSNLMKMTGAKGRNKMTKTTLLYIIMKEKNFRPDTLPFNIRVGVPTDPIPSTKTKKSNMNLQQQITQEIARRAALPDDEDININDYDILMKNVEFKKNTYKYMLSNIVNLIDDKEKLTKLINLISIIRDDDIKLNDLFSMSYYKDITTAIENELIRLSSSFSTRREFVKINLIDTVTGTKTFFVFNYESVRQIMGLLLNGSIEEENELNFSATILDFMIKQFNFSDVEQIGANLGVKPDKNGKFFNMLNISPFDLTRYQIIKSREELPLLNNHCFVYAMMMSGQFDEYVINAVKLHLKDNYLKKIDIIKITKIINRKVEVYHYNSGGKKIEMSLYGKEYEKVFKLSLFNSHYFIYEPINITRFALKNWKMLDSMCGYDDIKTVKQINSKGEYIYEKDKTISSLSVINALFKSESFVTSGIFSEVHDILGLFSEKSYVPMLDNIKNECRPMVGDKYIRAKTVVEDFKDIVFADIESVTKGGKHEAMAIGFENLKGNIKNTYVVQRPNERQYLFNYFFDAIMYYNGVNLRTGKRKPKGEKKEDPAKFLIYFHNLKYDKSFFKNMYACTNVCEKAGILYEFTIFYRGAFFIFRDSYKIITAKLSAFTGMFGIETCKDVLPYDLYDEMTIYKKSQKVSDALKHLPEEKHEQFLNNLSSLSLYTNDDKTKFKHMEYMKYYLVKDVEVLRAGMIKQRELFMGLCGLSIFDYLTIPSITHHNFMKDGVYDGVYQLGGQVRCFVQKSVRGGRVATMNNSKWNIKAGEHGNVVDFDGISLYPSAIDRICQPKPLGLGGIPLGCPKLLKKENCTLEKLNEYDYYTVEIRINRINKHLPISFISDVVDDETIYSNDVPKNLLVVDKITLEDWIKFQHIEFDIIRGVYWDEGVNPLFGEKMRELHKKRAEYKAVKNVSMSTCVKLVMNSAYGKNIMKASTTTRVNKLNITEENKNDIEKFTIQNYNRIVLGKEYEQYVEFELRQSFAEHYNSCHVGAMILSMSKRIMNEVMATAFDNDIKIFYQDTDSMHMFQNDIKKLSDEYNKKYNRVLIGDNLGQFHSDFEISGQKKGTDVVSTTCIILGKKAYMDVLEGVNDKGEIINSFHVKMKGVNEAAMDDAIIKHGGYVKLYEKLYEGETINFDLCADKFRPRFEYDADGNVFTRQKFTRSVHFKYPKGKL